MRSSKPVLSFFAGCALAVLAGASQAAPAPARTPAPANAAAPEDDLEVEAFVVTAGRQQGAVIGDIPPVLQLGPRDVQAYGLNSVAELVEALSPQTASAQGRGGGRPPVLVNGARVSGFNEIRDLPTEAILRVDILPEEVALKYGYPADQQVVNLVLRPRFRALTTEAGYTIPTEGGGDSVALDANQVLIRRDNRMQIDLKATQDSPLLESDRDILGRTDSEFRTLRSAARNVALNATLSRPLGGGVSGTINGTLEAGDSLGQIGLSPFSTRALERRTETLNGELAVGLRGAFKGWLWTYTGGAQRSETRNTTERVRTGLGYTDKTRSVSTSANSELVINRSLFELPAGAVTTTLTAAASTLKFDSSSLRAGVQRDIELSRDSGELRANLDVPLINRNKNKLGPVGNLSANFNASVENLSDFGALNTIGAGLNWSPVAPLRLIASYSREEGAPSVQQIGNPELATPGVRVFDLRRGETAEIVRIDGGTPNLEADSRRVLKLGLNLKPFSKTDLTFTANYTNAKTDNVIAAFPSASTQVEDAFPDRFVRDAAGRLIQIDARPVNFESQEREELRWGLNFRMPIKSARPPPPPRDPNFRRPGAGQGQGQRQAAPGAPADGAPPQQRPRGNGPPPGAPGVGGQRGPGGGPGGGGFRGGFGGFGGPRGAGGGVFQIGLYHTVVFKDRITIRSGIPVLDLLNGASTGAGGGASRHLLDLQSNLTRDGLGIAVNARWQSPTAVMATGAGAGDLRFSSLATVNLRLFADLGQQTFARQHRWLRGARVSFAVNNLFNERQQVTTPQGVIPISYQPGYLNPVGRTLKFTVRKIF